MKGPQGAALKDQAADTLMKYVISKWLKDNPQPQYTMAVTADNGFWRTMKTLKEAKHDTKFFPPIPQAQRDAQIAQAEKDAEAKRDVIRQRFVNEYNRHEVEIIGDGNCQFRAIAHQYLGFEDLHTKVGEIVVEELRQNFQERIQPVEGIPVSTLKICQAMDSGVIISPCKQQQICSVWL
ncbi:unnamed protein product [Arabis nemorensis]|uniref:OTU domain-containing protein n=1 Tax=Arabis nemorensis TaxID=586526 RepID=A0A565ATR3_9BRAS|nr:unnamed protein product [Arabis nemorensis]